MTPTDKYWHFCTGSYPILITRETSLMLLEVFKLLFLFRLRMKGGQNLKQDDLGSRICLVTLFSSCLPRQSEQGDFISAVGEFFFFLSLLFLHQISFIQSIFCLSSEPWSTGTCFHSFHSSSSVVTQGLERSSPSITEEALDATFGDRNHITFLCLHWVVQEVKYWDTVCKTTLFLQKRAEGGHFHT